MKTPSKIFAAILAPWSSRKLWMSIIGLVIVHSQFWAMIWYLYSFNDPAHIAAFEALCQTCLWTTSAIVLGYLGIQGVMDNFGRNVVSSTSQVVQNILQKKESREDINITITEKVDPQVVERFAQQYESDPSYRPISTIPDLDTNFSRP